MKIGIIPTIREPYSLQYEFSIDQNLLKFFRKAFPSSDFIFLTEKKKYNIDLLCISGGNDINTTNGKNKLRKSLDEFFYKIYKRINIPIIGICHGAQFIFKNEGGRLINSNKHVGRRHNVIYLDKLSNRKIFKKNSFHTFVIPKLNSKFEAFAWSNDNFIEGFESKKNRTLCFMWHPEREEKFHNLDIFKVQNLI